jgi:hypothetical protein
VEQRNGLCAGCRRGQGRFLSNPSLQLVLLAPSATSVPKFFSRVETDAHRFDNLMAEMQRLRGGIYLRDGAIAHGALTEGRHQLPADPLSWHLLVLDQEQRVRGCARYREHPNEICFSRLGVSGSTLAQCPQWGERLRSAVGAELALSRCLGVPYVELGGWALIEQIRRTTEALRMALTTYALAQALGGGVGISTATTRHGSSSILRGVGGRPLEYENSELPSYHDFKYGCEMEVLRFYSWAPNPRYAGHIAEIRAQLSSTQVFTGNSRTPDWKSPQAGFYLHGNRDMVLT